MPDTLNRIKSDVEIEQDGERRDRLKTEVNRCISLLRSMVDCGEQHSEKSLQEIRNARAALERL